MFDNLQDAVPTDLPNIHRYYQFIDGYTLLTLDHYPQQPILIDLSDGVFESTFKPPLFQDDTQTGINLLNP